MIIVIHVLQKNNTLSGPKLNCGIRQMPKLNKTIEQTSEDYGEWVLKYLKKPLSSLLH